MKQLTFISLFTGIGGLDLGLEMAGLRCVYQVEQDKFCRAILTKRWPGIPKHGDINTFGRDIYSGHADLVCGGDPCQANSIARGDQGGGTFLTVAFLRVLDLFRPPLVLRENPPALKRAPWPWHRFRMELEARGYAVIAFRLRACCAGADHRRERVFVLAHLLHATGVGPQGHPQGPAPSPRGDLARPAWPSPAPRVCRRLTRVPHGVDRSKALGNAVDVRVGYWIGRRILAAANGITNL